MQKQNEKKNNKTKKHAFHVDGRTKLHARYENWNETKVRAGRLPFAIC